MGNRFHLACWHGDDATFQDLQQKGDFKIKSIMSTVGVFGVQPLHIIAFRGHYSMLNVLILSMEYEDFDNTFGPQSLTASDIARYQKNDPLEILRYYRNLLRMMHFFQLIPAEVVKYRGFEKIFDKFQYASTGKRFMKALKSQGISEPFPDCPHYFTPLYVAVLANNVEAVRLLLKDGAEVHHYISNGAFNLLHAAARHNRYEIIPLLIDAGANLFEKNPAEKTPFCVAARWGQLPAVTAICSHPKFDLLKSNGNLALFVAAQEGHFHVISKLVKLGCDIHYQYGSNHTPLHISVCNNHSGVVRALLDHNADSNKVNFFHDTPLHVAAEYGSSDVIGPLLDSGASLYNPNGALMTPPEFAACHNQLGFLKTAMEKHNYDVNQQDQYGYTLLHTILSLRNPRLQLPDNIPKPTLHLIRSLVRLGCSMKAPDSEGYLPIHFATHYDDTQAIAEFIRLGVNVDTPTACPKKRRPIHIAAGRNCVNSIAVLFDQGCDLEAPQETPLKYRPLHVALHHRSKEACQKLLDLGADINSTMSFGWTGVFLTIQNNMQDMLEILLQNGASVSVNTSSSLSQADQLLFPAGYQSTPLRLAILFERAECVKQLLQFGAMNTLDFGCLETAAIKGRVEILQILKEYGADLDSVWSDERLGTLHFAILENQVSTVQFLIEAGCDLTKCTIRHNKRDLSPLQLATLLCHSEIVDALCRKFTPEELNTLTHDGLSLPHLALVNPIVRTLGLDGKITHSAVPNAALYEEQRARTIDILLNHQAIDLNLMDDHKITALDIAVQKQLKDIVFHLVQSWALRGETKGEIDKLKQRIDFLERSFQGSSYDEEPPNITVTRNLIETVQKQQQQMDEMLKDVSELKRQGKGSENGDALKSLEGFLSHFYDVFISSADAKVVASDLRRRMIIPEEVETQIERAFDQRRANGHLYDHLCRQATGSIMLNLCRVFAEHKGYHRMNQLGEDMEAKLLHNTMLST